MGLARRRGPDEVEAAQPIDRAFKDVFAGEMIAAIPRRCDNIDAGYMEAHLLQSLGRAACATKQIQRAKRPARNGWLGPQLPPLSMCALIAASRSSIATSSRLLAIPPTTVESA